MNKTSKQTLAGRLTGIVLFGVKKLRLLRRFRPFNDGTPYHSRLGDILAVLDAEQFQRCFVARAAAVTGAPVGVISIDPETVRRSGHLNALGDHTAQGMAVGWP